VAAIEQARAEPVEEAEIHRATGQQSVRPGVVERQDRLRARARHHGGESFVDDVERLRPRDALESAPRPSRHAPERRLETPLAVHEAGIRLRNLRAQNARRVRVRPRAADREDPVVLDGDGSGCTYRDNRGDSARVFGFHALFLHVVGGVEKSH